MKRLIIVSMAVCLCLGLFAACSSDQYSVAPDFRDILSAEEAEDLHDYFTACEAEAAQIQKGELAGYSGMLQIRVPLILERWSDIAVEDLTATEKEATVKLMYFQMGLADNPMGGNNPVQVMIGQSVAPDVEPYESTVSAAEIGELKGLFFTK